jgi:hypothetical protein
LLVPPLGAFGTAMSELAIFSVKLLLAILAFVLVVWLGARDKRIGGVLLTFPLLNGIAMLTGFDPVAIAGTIYLIVMWNCLLFLLAMHRFEWLPPLPAGLNQEPTIVVRALVWVALWTVGASLLAWFRDNLPPGWWLFGIQLAIAACYIATRWREGASPSRPTFSDMWLNRTGCLRIVCFVAAFLVLSAVASLAHSARWVGWASALPLPGIFALATLSATQKKEDMLSLADTVLLGPLLVLPFNWLLAHTIVHLRIAHAGIAAEIVTVVCFWAVAAALVFALVPRFARWRDRR